MLRSATGLNMNQNELKMKVLWLSNVYISDNEISSTGTWIIAMAKRLQQEKNINLFIISKGDVGDIEQKDNGNIKQWILPNAELNKEGLPPQNLIFSIQEIINGINPDIIHIWGTEYYWSKLYTEGYIKGKVLLEMQGLISAIATKVTADLTFREMIDCIGFKEILKPTTFLLCRKKYFEKRGALEIDTISKHKHIATQSDWMRGYIRNINKEAKIYRSAIGLRPEFLNTTPHNYSVNNLELFTLTSTISAYKGLHTLIKALAIVKSQYKDVILKIAGPLPVKGVKKPGYERFLQRLIIKHDLSNNVKWLGSLNAIELIGEMKKSRIVVLPSFIESYSLALREALTIGMPVVASFAGAMPELANHNKSAIYFPPGDFQLCAHAIVEILTSKELEESLRINALQKARELNRVDCGTVQIEIYQQIMFSEG